MNAPTITAMAVRTCSRLLSLGATLLIASYIVGPEVRAGDVNLESASNFAVLAGATITNTGLTTVQGGGVGLSPGTAITGFPPGMVDSPYVVEAANAATLQAESDLDVAFNTAAGLAPTQVLTGINLGGLTLTPGVYFFASSAQLTGTLTLNDQGNPNAVFVFQIGSTLTTATDSSVATINDPSTPGIGVFWQVGSSATLGTGTDFEGNVLADTSITVNTNATVDGRLLAENGSVTLEGDTILVPPMLVSGGGGGGSGGGGDSVPDAGSVLVLLGLGLAALCVVGNRTFGLT
jgi:hypothetical protein